MRLKAAYAACLLTCAAVVYLLTPKAADPLSGVWTGTWGTTPVHRNSVTVELKWDGETLTGTINPGPNAIQLQKASFDSRTGAVHLEAEVVSLVNSVHYVIQGKVENDALTGRWNHDDRKGDFKIVRKVARIPPRRRLF